MIGFLLDYFVRLWPAFLTGLLVGAFASCRSYSNVVEATLLCGAALVMAVTMFAEYTLIRRERKRLRAELEHLIQVRVAGVD